MKRIEYLVQTREITSLIKAILDDKCSYCCVVEDACDGCCSNNIKSYLNQEMVIDFNKIMDELRCNQLNCEECALNGLHNCKTLLLWREYGEVR